MRHRIRVSALTVHDDTILLVRHVVDGREWWCPPGGGVDGDEPLLAAAERELREETGVNAKGKQVVYLLDFIVQDPPCRNLEVYVLMETPIGEPRVPAAESRFLKAARYIRHDDLSSLTVYPAVLRDAFWHDRDAGFPETRYLGVTTMET